MRILWAIFVFSSTFSIKSLSVTTVTTAAGLKSIMAEKQHAPRGTTKPKAAPAKAAPVKAAQAEAPTMGLEDVVF